MCLQIITHGIQVQGTWSLGVRLGCSWYASYRSTGTPEGRNLIMEYCFVDSSPSPAELRTQGITLPGPNTRAGALLSCSLAGPDLTGLRPVSLKQYSIPAQLCLQPEVTPTDFGMCAHKIS